jgi:sensor domain CHASE-containing protein
VFAMSVRKKVLLIAALILLAAVVIVIYVSFFTERQTPEYDGTLVRLNTEARRLLL